MSTQAITTADPTLAALGDNAPYARGNQVRGVVAGAFAETGREFLNPDLILGALILALTGSALLASIVPVINKVGLMGPQLLFGSRIEHLPRRQPLFVIVTIVRSTAMFALVGSIGLLAVWGPTDGALALFYLAYLAVCSATSFAHVVFIDMVGRLIPRHRTASFMSMRMMVGGSLSMVVAFLVIQPILTALPTPQNFIVLSAISAVLVVIDMSIWCTARERPGHAAPTRPSLAGSLKRGFGWLRHDRTYRAFLFSRVGFRISYLGLALFIPFGEAELGREGVTGVALLGGLFVGTMKVSGIVGSGLWGHVADRMGSRFTLACAGALLVVAPLLAVTAAFLPTAYTIPMPGVDRPLDLPLTVYMLGLVVQAFGMRAQILGGQRLLITNAPLDRRPTYVSFINTLTSPLTLLPLAGAALAELVGMSVVFSLISVGGMIMLAASLRMDPHDPNRPVGPESAPSDPDAFADNAAPAA